VANKNVVHIKVWKSNFVCCIADFEIV